MLNFEADSYKIDHWKQYPPAPIVLYDYQVEDRAKVADAFFDKGIHRQLGVWPTGSGKTVLFSELHLEPRLTTWMQSKGKFAAGNKILVIAHRLELIQQAVDKIMRSNPLLDVQTEMAGKRARREADVIVASIQTLTAHGGKRLHRLNPDEFAIVVIDEAHHAASPSYLAVLQYLGFLPPAEFMADQRPTRKDGKQKMLDWQRTRLDLWDAQFRPDRLLLGVTATPIRGDNVGLECAFQEITFNRTIREMIERGRLSRIRAFRVDTTTSLDAVKTRAGDFRQEELAEAVNEQHRNHIAVKAYLDYAAGRKGLTFCVNVAHALSMAATYRAAGVPAAAIHGNMSEDERAKLLQAYRAGLITMLTNCQILTEGFDEPNIQVIVHARPTKSPLLYIQMTGRGLRIAEGKDDCVIIDIVDITKKHSLFTSPELLGLPADFDAKGGDLLETKQAFEAAQAAHPQVDLSDIKNLDDIKLRVSEVDLLGSFHDENLDHHASLAWHRTGEGYELDWRGELLSEFMQVKQDGSKWRVTKLTGRKEQFSQTLNTAKEALQFAETWIRNNQSHIARMCAKAAPWRQQPADEGQRNMLKAMKIPVNSETLTKGEAHNLISLHYSKQRKAQLGME